LRSLGNEAPTCSIGTPMADARPFRITPAETFRRSFSARS
jgi:hypothetical protein